MWLTGLASLWHVGSSPVRDGTHVSCVSSGFFTIESPGKPKRRYIHSLYLVPGIVNAQKMIKPMRAQCYFSRRWQQKGLSGKKEEEQAGEPFRMSWVWSAAAKSLQSCPTLCDPIDGSPPGSPVPGILQARTLEWVAISFSNA